MTAATRWEALSLYSKIFRIARTWQSLSGLTDETMKEKQYIITEARALFRKNKDLTDLEEIKQCIKECHARIEMGLHYRIPYPRPMHLPPMGLGGKKERKLRTQERLRKIAKPVYLQSQEET
ncbi:LYR motif-containing protein 1 [Callorhinchus milii]|uniref:LYR motif containing 1 n=1 Tax=Callorhinchus milii TaxID=7868 RepID=V9LCB3_CALMI|nr:LYR motif-containing protein 1 [Callorhinchus milii]XP_042197072.1 LYR motif-containing protein 1 [Callorhinchus milii]XP_042197073.1 LYR motif-containing protein 1 [Callorhinchus milii]|eukprot:gi/632952491/ref/XP_007891880.1/ PREDICTED: LYR motif-containing protein 1 [Callorhinchus milii]